ncbi:MAG TPA: recombinase family protein [Patescibacteria group bacterium]|nr:recombinase family protein [Patescibacteria group bacterium]
MKLTQKQAILYLRVSTEEQVDNYSMGTQEEVCRRETDRLGYVVTQVYREEGKSAKTITGRIELIKLLEYCRRHTKDVQAVVFYKTDRLSRQMTDYLIIKEKLNRMGIKLISATEPVDDTPMGKFIGNFYAGIAQLDNEMKSERARNGMHARFQSGLLCSGKAQLGYIRHEGYVFKDTKVWDQVKKAWELMATGTKSLREMTNIMNSWGLRTTINNQKYLIRRQTVHRIFRSKFYAGFLVSKRYNEEVHGQHEPMVSKELFEKVQAILDGRHNKPSLVLRNPPNVDFPLRRIVKCGKCGLGFTGSWCSGHLKKYPYYWCYKSQLCHSPYVPAEKLHKLLKSLLTRMKLSKLGRVIIYKLLQEEYERRYSKIRMYKAKREQLVGKLIAMRTNLVHKHLSGLYTDEVFCEQNALLSDNIDRIKLSIKKSFLQEYTLSTCITYMNSNLENIYNTYMHISVDNQKAILSTIFPRGFVWNYPGLSYPKINPLFEV